MPVLLLIGVVVVGYVVYLDHAVTVKFDGKHWAVPARVFGRPLDLYSGANVTPQQLEAELQRLGYRKVQQVDMDATWSRDRNHFVLRTRPFISQDGTHASRTVDIRFAGGRVSELKDLSGVGLTLVQLEAPEIGSIYPAHNEDRVLVQHSDLPRIMVQALIEVEDRSFNSHFGVDPKAILRALWANIRAGGVVQGGSTLTQQLVKNFYLNHERTLWRKINEAIMALLLEAHYPKDAILQAYANEIYLGQDGNRAIHGFGLASHFYFNRPLNELDLPKMALLVALVKGPSYYDPRRNPERAIKRRNMVLNILREQGHLTAEQERLASTAPLGVAAKGSRGGSSYPAFIDLVRRQLHRDYQEEDLTSEGLRIFTTLDPWVQSKVEAALAGRLPRLEQQHGLPEDELQGAAVVVGADGGEVLAVAGDRNPGFAGFNRALDAVRPIGSLVKPVVYLTALMEPRRWSLVSPLEDEPISIEGWDGSVWSPQNYDKKSHGTVLLHEALTRSYNLATVHLGMSVGLEQVAAMLRSMGVARPFNSYPSMLLGAVALSPLEVAQLYQTLAAGGFYSPIRAIRAVQDSSGESLQRYPLTLDQVVPPAPVYLLNSNLQEVVRRGTAAGLRHFLSPELGIAGKTGTTDELRDSWFAGFSGDKVAVVWVGRDDNQPASLTGASGALKVWGEMMQSIRPEPLVLAHPEGIETVAIDPATGLRAGRWCNTARNYPFIMDSAPTAYGSCGRGVLDNVFQGFFND
jgi:penicillin-binding protein 1B